MKYVPAIDLGDRVRCRYTGLRGTAVQRVEYLGSDVRKIAVQPDSTADNGSLPSPEYVPENWLEVDKREPIGLSVGNKVP